MLLKTFYKESKVRKNEWHWVENYLYAVPLLPSGHTKIVYGQSRGGVSASGFEHMHYYDIKFEDFIRHRRAGTSPEMPSDG